MRIGVDYRLANKHLGGMAVYLTNLVTQLKKVDDSNDYLLFDSKADDELGFRKHPSTIISEHFWLQIQLPSVMKKDRIDIVYFPNPPVSFFIRLPILLTIPDVSFIYDTSMAWWIKTYLWTMYFLSAHRANQITTFSNNSKQDICKFFTVNAEKIHVTSLAVSLKPTSRTKKENYILTVPGTIIPRKNINDAIKAFHHLPTDLQQQYKLIIVGHPQSENFDNVVFTGRISEKELSDYYCRSKLFICTSLYEGFGLPILEAMTCGTPVISYNNSSLPEVVGEAGLLVDDVTQLGSAMQEVLQNKRLQKALIAKGRIHVQKFSWAVTASSFIKCLPQHAK